MSNSNRIALWVIGLLLLLGVTAYVYWFAENFERHTREVRTAVSPEARKNRFLAAEYFLQRNGQEAQSHSGRDIFGLEPSTDDTIFLGNHSSLFLDRNNSKLIDWVSAGGNLVLALDDYAYDDEREFPLLDELGVELRFTYDETESEECSGSEDDCSDNGNTEEALDSASPDEDDGKDKVTVTFRTDHPGEFTARFNADRYLADLDDMANVVIGREGFPNLLRFSLGNGSVTVLSDADLFSNFEIDSHDHAYLLHQLVYAPGKVWILYSADMPSLLGLLWKNTPLLLLSGIALLLLAGWSLFRKSGPLLLPQHDSRRNLLEHLDATAEYSWRVDKARQLFEANRKAIEHAWRRRHPQLNTLEQEERCNWIGEKTGLAPRAVRRTLYEQIESEQDFIRATAVLQRLATRINQPAGFTAEQSVHD